MITKDLKILTTYTIVKYVHYSEVRGDILRLPHAVNPCPAEPAFANSVDPDQLASEEANWSGSALFAIHYSNLNKQPWSSNLIGWKLEVGMAFWQGLKWNAI